MKTVTLTVFTEPISATGFLPRIKSLVRPVKFFLRGKKKPVKKKYGGHHAVTRSLLEGLKKAGVDFNYNPPAEKEIAENVIVLSGVERLKELIELKKNGRIRKLLAGPNIVEDVRSENQLVADPAIDYYIVPSPWVRDLAEEDCEKLKDRVRCWYAGIDTEYWKPAVNKEERDQVLIYWKTEPEEFYHDIIALVDELGWNHTTIKYGSYSVDEYKRQLDRSRVAIFISRSESQGIAQVEAWSMEVPTLVFEPHEFFFGGRILHNVSSSPYLDRTTGLTWKTLDELRTLVTDKSYGTGFSPREYVLRKFTDEYCAKQLLNVLNN